MSDKLNLYEKLFLYIFISTTRTNKSIPEWSTTIFLSVITANYLLSFGILSPFDMKIIGRNGFIIFMLASIAIHWHYFLRNNRITNKFQKVKPKTSFKGKILTGLYTLGGFAILFYSIEAPWFFILLVTILLGVVELCVHWFGTEPIKYE